MKPVAYTIHFFSIIALATILVSSCSLLTFLEITDIELDHSSKTLSIGEKFQLSADITPSDAAETDINWSSSAPETVSVSGVGMLQALSLGEAVITAVSSTDDQIEAECVVTVKASVNYDVNGAESGQPPVDSELYAIGDKVTVKELPDDSGLPRTNYKFKNWNTSSDGSGTSCEAGDTLEVTKNSGNINVYAQWIRLEDPGVSIAFANPDNPDINFSGTYPEVNMGSTFTVSASLESAGYTWYLDGDKQTITDTSSPISQAGDTLQSVSIDTSGLSIGTHTVTVITDEFYSSSFSFTVISEDFVGQGTEDDPFQIRTLDDLRFLTQHPEYWDSYFVQTADIDAEATQYWDDSDDDSDGDAYNDANDAADAGDNEGFLPIGNKTTPFTGSYDGGNHDITGLSIDRPESANVGLFGYAQGDAYLHDLILSNVNIVGEMSIGALLGTYRGIESRIERCSLASGSVEGSRDVGGIAGLVNGSGLISSSSSMADATISGTNYVGGIVGTMVQGEGELEDCFVGATIKNRENEEYEVNGDIKSVYNIGGIVGVAGNKGSADVRRCEFNGAIEISKVDGDEGEVNIVGGLIGINFNNSTVVESRSSGSIQINTSSDVGSVGGLIGVGVGVTESRSSGSIQINTSSVVGSVGGLIGKSYGLITESGSSGSIDITAETTYRSIGGFAGESKGTLEDCFSRSPVSVNATSQAHAGGFVGNVSDGAIERCYAAGSLNAAATGGDSPVVSIGGFAVTAGSAVIADSFWSTDAAGDYDSVSGSESYEGITKSNDSNMQTEDTFTGAGWDFDNGGIWTMPWDSSINDGYPIFQYMIPQ